jgi:hypothetical protein
MFLFPLYFLDLLLALALLGVGVPSALCSSHAGAKAAAAAVAANGYRVPEVPVAAHRQLAAESNAPAGRLPPIARCVEAGTHEAKTNAPVEPEFLLPVPMKSLCVCGGAVRVSGCSAIYVLMSVER